MDYAQQYLRADDIIGDISRNEAKIEDETFPSNKQNIDDDDEPYLFDEEPPSYDMTEKLKEINSALAKQMIPIDYDERPRKVIFRENPVDCVIPPTPTYSSDEDDGYGDSTEVSDDLPDDNEGDATLDLAPGNVSVRQEQQSDDLQPMCHESVTNESAHQSKLSDDDDFQTFLQMSSSLHPPDENTLENRNTPQMNCVADEIDYIFKCFSRLSVKSSNQVTIDPTAIYTESINQSSSIISSEDGPIVEWDISQLPSNDVNSTVTGIDGTTKSDESVPNESYVVHDPPVDSPVSCHQNENHLPSSDGSVNKQDLVSDDMGIQSEALRKWKRILRKLRCLHPVPIENAESGKQDQNTPFEQDNEKSDPSSEIRSLTSAPAATSLPEVKVSEIVPSPPKCQKTDVHKFRSNLLKTKLNGQMTMSNNAGCKQNSLFSSISQISTSRINSPNIEIGSDNSVARDTVISEETTMIMASQGKFCVMKTEDFKSGNSNIDLSDDNRAKQRLIRPKSSRPTKSVSKNGTTLAKSTSVPIKKNRTNSWEERKEVFGRQQISSGNILRTNSETNRQRHDINGNSLSFGGRRLGSSLLTSKSQTLQLARSPVLQPRSHTAPAASRRVDSTYRLTLEQKLEKERYGMRKLFKMVLCSSKLLVSTPVSWLRRGGNLLHSRHSVSLASLLKSLARQHQLRKEAEAQKKLQRKREVEDAYRQWLERKKTEGSLMGKATFQFENSVRNPPVRPRPSQGSDGRAFQAWLRRKKMQKLEEMKIEELKRKTEEYMMCVRKREDNEKAFKKWLKQKSAEESRLNYSYSNKYFYPNYLSKWRTERYLLS